jgi:hypothetical protein
MESRRGNKDAERLLNRSFHHRFGPLIAKTCRSETRHYCHVVRLLIGNPESLLKVAENENVAYGLLEMSEAFRNRSGNAREFVLQKDWSLLKV